MRMFRLLPLAATLLLPVLASCDTAPTDPTLEPGELRLAVTAAESELVACGQEIPVLVEATNEKGRPVRDVIVNFNVLAGGGSMFSGSAATSPLGQARDYWAIGFGANTRNTLAVRAVDPSTGERKTYFEQTVVTGTRVAWADASSIYTALPDLSDERFLTDGYDPAWSPDGQRIAYAYRPAPEVSHVWVMDVADPSSARRLTHSRLFTAPERDYIWNYPWAEDPDWSPDGQWVAVELPHYRMGMQLYSEVALVEADADDPLNPEVRLLGEGFDPVWAADGGRLLVTVGSYEHPVRQGVAILSVDGLERTDLFLPFSTPTGRWVGYYQADWSPDGAYIALVREDTDAGTWGPMGLSTDWGGYSAVHVANADGTGIRQVTPFTAHVRHPRWSPDGGHILYERVTEDFQRAELWRVRPDGTGDEQLGGPWYTEFSTAAPDWSGCVGPWPLE